jgi:hypothetical protein
MLRRYPSSRHGELRLTARRPAASFRLVAAFALWPERAPDACRPPRPAGGATAGAEVAWHAWW